MSYVQIFTKFRLLWVQTKVRQKKALFPLKKIWCKKRKFGITHLTSIWVLHTPTAGQNMPFQCLHAKKSKREEKAWKLRQNLTKNQFFSLHQHAGRRCYSQKNWLISLNIDYINCKAWAWFDWSYFGHNLFKAHSTPVLLVLR